MEYEFGSSMIIKAIEMERDTMLHMQWCVQLPFMSKDTYESFSDYRDRLTGSNIDRRPKEMILAEIEEIEKKFANRRE
jgi:hypothetical protein